jgi:hypothetical protein
MCGDICPPPNTSVGTSLSILISAGTTHWDSIFRRFSDRIHWDYYFSEIPAFSSIFLFIILKLYNFFLNYSLGQANTRRIFEKSLVLKNSEKSQNSADTRHSGDIHFLRIFLRHSRNRMEFSQYISDIRLTRKVEISW